MTKYDEWDYVFLYHTKAGRNGEKYTTKTLDIFHRHKDRWAEEYHTTFQLFDFEWENDISCKFCLKKMPEKLENEVKLKLILQKYKLK